MCVLVFPHDMRPRFINVASCEVGYFKQKSRPKQMLHAGIRIRLHETTVWIIFRILFLILMVKYRCSPNLLFPGQNNLLHIKSNI